MRIELIMTSREVDDLPMSSRTTLVLAIGSERYRRSVLKRSTHLEVLISFRGYLLVLSSSDLMRRSWWFLYYLVKPGGFGELEKG